MADLGRLSMVMAMDAAVVTPSEIDRVARENIRENIQIVKQAYRMEGWTPSLLQMLEDRMRTLQRQAGIQG